MIFATMILAYSISFEQVGQFLNLLLSIDPSVYAVLVGGAGGVSAITQLVKKGLKLKNDKVIVMIFTAFSLIASAVVYLATGSDLPPEVLGVSTVTLMGLATPIYRFVVKPASNLISFYNTYKPQIDAKLAAIEDAPIPEDVVEAAAAVGSTPVLTTVETPGVATPEGPAEKKQDFADF